MIGRGYINKAQSISVRGHYTNNLLESFNVLPQKTPSVNINNLIYNLPKINLYDISKKASNGLFEYQKPVYDEFSNLLFKNGWWIILSLPRHFFFSEKIKELLKTYTITDIIISYFNSHNSKNLVKIVQKWDLECFSDNSKIFEDALWAHKKEKYTLTVPTLTIQLEGVLRTYFEDITEKSVHKYRNELINKYQETIIPEAGFLSYMQQKNLDFLENSLNKFYTGEKSISIPKEHTELSRHIISHGKHKNYDNIINSTKLFLLLDMLHFTIRSIEKQV